MFHIYHPTKTNKGFACSFWFSIREKCVFATIVKQAGWDEKADNGLFKASLEDPTKHVNIKLSDIEVGHILECLDKNRDFKTYHDNELKPKHISFTTWMGAAQKDVSGAVIKEACQQGFSFSISVIDKEDSTNKNSFYIGLNFGEARLLREFLLFALHHFFEERTSLAANKNNNSKSKTIDI